MCSWFLSGPFLSSDVLENLDTCDAFQSVMTAAQGNEKPKKRKRFSTKVKTGCQTCKLRRVKCDEEQPFCRRCTSTGRKCDGYRLQVRPHQAIVPTNSLSLIRTGATLTKIHGTTEESRSLEFYFVRAAPKISGLLGDKFWSRLVYQIGYTEPAVRHALIAIGYLFEKEGKAYNSQSCEPHADIKDDFLFHQYNRAIGHLVKHMSECPSSVHISIVTCILFVCLEFLMEQPHSCYVHFKSGLEILFNARASKAIGPVSSVGLGKNAEESPTLKTLGLPKGPTDDFIEESLVPLFTRLSLGALLHGADDSYISFTNPTILRNLSITFSNVEQSWHILADLMNQALKFIRMTSTKKFAQTSLSQDDMDVHSSLLFSLERWLQSQEKYEHDNRQNHKRNPKLCSVRLFFRCAWIWLSCCIDPLEMEYDYHTAGFQEIVSLGQILLESSLTPSDTTEFDFAYDMEFIGPMYFGASRCRDPQLRRKALSILAKRRRREGLWDSKRCVMIAERIIAIEEAGLCESVVQMLPPARYRIHEATIEVASPSFSSTFFTLPDGLGSEHFRWHETFHL